MKTCSCMSVDAVIMNVDNLIKISRDKYWCGNCGRIYHDNTNTLALIMTPEANRAQKEAVAENPSETYIIYNRELEEILETNVSRCDLEEEIRTILSYWDVSDWQEMLDNDIVLIRTSDMISPIGEIDLHINFNI